jgi:hypothetical protein
LAVKAAKTVLVLILIATVLNALKLETCITYAIPFCGGMPPSIYDVVGVAVILTTLWGLHHLGRSRRHHE